MEETPRTEPTVMPQRSGVSVVVPTLNEAASIGEFIGKTARVLVRLGVPAEIVVVDDASSDGTAEIAEGIAPKLPVPLRIIPRSGPRSLSLSVVDGARAAVHPVVVVLDADLSHDPEDLPRVIAPVVLGEAEIAVGSRYVLGGAISGWPLRRRVMSAIGTSLARAVTRVRDPLSGFFAARREHLDDTAGDLRPRGYKILLELLGRVGRVRIVEVPIRFRDRKRGRSKFGLHQGAQFLEQVLALILARLGRRVPGVGRERGTGVPART